MSLASAFGRNMTPAAATEKFVAAFRAHDFKRARRLIETGLVDPNIVLSGVPKPEHYVPLNDLDGPALMAAVELKQHALVRAMIEAGADVDAGNGAVFRKPIQRAVIARDAGLVRLLLRAGAKDGLEQAYDRALQQPERDIQELLAKAIDDIRSLPARRLAERHANIRRAAARRQVTVPQ